MPYQKRSLKSLKSPKFREAQKRSLVGAFLPYCLLVRFLNQKLRKCTFLCTQDGHVMFTCYVHGASFLHMYCVYTVPPCVRDGPKNITLM